MCNTKTLTASRLKWLFKLPGLMGLFFVLSCACLAIRIEAQVLLIPSGSSWKYLDDGSNQGTAWRATNFNDSSWPVGPAQFGYGEGDEATLLNYGTNSNNKYITYYFRRTFNIADPTLFTNLTVGAVRDDGLVVYLNGNEVWRNNMPSGTITYTTVASTNVNGPDESVFFRTNLSPSVLRAGANVCAVEVHQNGATSTDVSFDLFLVGSTATPSTNGLAFHVAPNGNDDWSGTLPQGSGNDGPFATLERARDVIRSWRMAGYSVPGPIVVEVAGGRYDLTRTFTLTSADSGTAQAPVTFRAKPGEEVQLSGGRIVRDFFLVTDETTLARLDPSARGKVWRANLPAQGITNFTNTWSALPGLEVFFQDRPMEIARWPNEGYVNIVKALGPSNNAAGGTVQGIFSYSGDRPTRWLGLTDVMLEGFWCYDWADQRQRVASIDTVSNIITLTPPWHTYGYRSGQWFYAYNILCELDQPGEWYLDRTSGDLFFWPPTPLTNANVIVSQINKLVAISNASFMTLQGFTLDASQVDGISINGGQSNLIQACTVRNVGRHGITINDSPGSGVSGCEIRFCGSGGVNLTAGDRLTLTPGGLYAEHNRIHHYARWNRVYNPALSLQGVGNIARHNLVHDAPHEGIAFGGNDHLMEYNEFFNLVAESNDAGVIYSGRNWTTRGHIIRYNYFHHVYGFQRKGGNCVYLDDQFCSALIYGNLFYDVPTAVLIGGGRENTVENNTFVKCNRAISIDARGLGWAMNNGNGITLTNGLLAMPYQSPPWSTRYPELTNILNENPMAPRNNLVTKNVSWNGGWTWIETAAQSGVIQSNNLVGVDPHFVDTNVLDFRLKTDSPAYPLGILDIPIDQIGPDTNVLHAPWPAGATLTQPVNGSTLGSPANPCLEAVLSDPAHTATQVQFFAGQAALGAAEIPFQLTVSNMPAGIYTLTAVPVSVGPPLPALNYARITVNDTLVATGSVWKYLDTGANLGTAWRATNYYNEIVWKSGRAQLGYGDGDEATVISFGSNTNNKYITSYFRRAFTVTDPSAYTNLVLGLLRDDGGVVYLNGEEVFRSNMTNGTITYTTLALSSVPTGDETITFYKTNLSPTLLHPGTNWLAVEIHQSSASSTDLSFDLYLHGQAGAAPILQAAHAPDSLLLSWPMGAADYFLEVTDDLSTGAWTTLSTPPLFTNGRLETLVLQPGPIRFYRLAKP